MEQLSEIRRFIVYFSRWVNYLKDLLVEYWLHLIIIFLIFYLVIQFIGLLTEWTSVRFIKVQVLHKERITKGRKNYYLIYTDKGTFKNTDTIAFLKYNSSDIYAKISINGRYKLKVCGYRWTFSSEYPNILKIEALMFTSI